MKKLFKILLGIIAAFIVLGLFGGLAWYVSSEGSAMGYVATGIFILMGLTGAFVAFAWIAMEDKSHRQVQFVSDTKKLAGKSRKKSKDEIDPVMMGIAVSMGMDDHTDDAGDIDSFGSDDFDD